jgi:membrane-bound serine protease (ClpP class)
MISGGFMRRVGLLLVFLAGLLIAVQAVHAQSSQPLVLLMNASGPIGPAMQDYIQRGIQTAEQRGAEAVIIQLSTPGGDILSLDRIIQDIRASTVPVVVYVAPNGAWAGSAGALMTMAAHVAAMAPETAIGASSPVGSGGQDLTTTEKAKASEIMKATIRPLVERRGAAATQLAQDMIDNAKAVSAKEALQAHLIDFIAVNTADVVKQLDGRTVIMPNGNRALHTANATTSTVDMSLIEQLLLILTDSNIVFILLAVGVLALQVELTHPGAWVPGLIGVTCVALAIYGFGLLPVNWFGLIFIITAFALFILDIKAPTHGALTAAGVASFIVGALVLFNSPGVPQFERVSVPLVVGVGIAIGLMFAGILTYALRAQRQPIQTGAARLIGKLGMARSDIGLTGQVQVESELWTAEAAAGSPSIGKGDKIEVVEVKGLRLRVRKV